MKKLALSTVPLLAALLSSCAPSGPSYKVYISNEGSGDLTVIDPVKMEAITTVAIGTRARGIHASADGKQIFVALSGSPSAPPGVDESTLPPPDKSRDGIGVFDVATNKFLRKVPGGSDPEQFAIGKDGILYVSNEDDAALSFVDPVKGTVLTNRSHRTRARGRHHLARRQIRLRHFGRQGHRHCRRHQLTPGHQDDQGGPPSARNRVPARWLARLCH